MSDLWATAMGAWREDFADLMLPSDRLPLSRADLVFIGYGTPGFSYTVTDPCPDSFSQVLKSNLTTVMSHYPMGAHLRLDLCSFRTSAATPRVVGMNGALWLMRQANPRVSGVIRRGLADGQPLSLFVFPWLPIPQWAEFRIFTRQGALAGISQLHSDHTFAQIAQHEAAIRAAMDTFVTSTLPRLRMPYMALDVLAEPLSQGAFRIRLVDMATLGPRTDHGLFSWDIGDDFDGSFRFRRADVTATMPPLPFTQEKTIAPEGQMTPAPLPAPEDDTWRI